jgi:DNA processing protein
LKFNFLLKLSLIPNIGPASILKITKKIKNKKSLSHKNLFSQLSPRIQKILETGLKDETRLEKELELIEKYKIKVYTFLDDDYPELLKQIYHPPPIIYCKGEPLKTNTKIAIVGSRKADNYAKRTIQNLVQKLVQNNFTIVSGGAAGVDSMAHEAALNFGGKTIVVFGSGLTHPYPSKNKELFRKIVRNNGTLISSFPLKTPPARGNFPARNRIVAGISQGCVVVQAASKSGALITSQFALDQGKQVFAIPGNIDNELSAGCHKLIQQGAKLVADADDIFEELGTPAAPFAPSDSPQNRSSRVPPQAVYRGRDPIIIFLEQPCTIDELLEKTEFSLPELQEKLFSLQLEGHVKQNFAGLWEMV